MNDSAGDRPAPAMSRQEALARLTAAGQPYELSVAPVYGRDCRTFVNAPKCLGQLFEEARSDATFIVYDDERLTFDETWRKAAQVATILRERYGVDKGDRVAISMRNFPEWVVGFMAATSIGAIAVAMNALWTSEEMAYGLEDSGSKVLLADEERLLRLAQLETPLDIVVISVRAATREGVDRLEDLLADAPPADTMPATDIAPDDDATIFYTSGSTGHPKGAVSSHRAILTALFSWELDLRAGLLAAGLDPEPEPPAEQTATLLAVPLFHATGSHAVYLMSYRLQRKLVCMYKWDPEQAAGLIEAERITQFVAPAAMTGDLIETARRTDRDLSTLLSVGGGGAPRAPEQVRSIEQSFEQALPSTGWGMTETNAIGTGIGGLDYLERPASSGRASAVLDLRVVDDDGAELPAGERGELQVRGTSLIRGYWQRPDANAATFEDGWLKTGDVAYFDDDGFLFIVDRIKDLVIRGGENIGCGEVEAALLEHPDILEASVYAVPDERLGEEVGATVYCRDEIDESALRDFLADHLARFKIPRYLTFRTEPLPRTASGKIFKRGLREEAVAAI